MPKPLRLPLPNYVVQGTATLTWTTGPLDKLGQSDKDEEDSIQFSPPNITTTKFKVKLHYSTCMDGMVTFWLSCEGAKEEMSLYCTLSVLSRKGSKYHRQDDIWQYNRTSNATLPLSYVSKEEYSKLLVNGCMEIYCQVDVLGPTALSPKEQLKAHGELCQDNETLLESGKWSDFVVLIGEREFKVHKSILATRSPVFAAMFEQEESREVKEARVVIEDVAVDVFELLLRYIYTGKVGPLGDKFEYTGELLAAADKYQLDRLKQICEDVILDNFRYITEQTVSGLFLISDMHNAVKLKNRCTEYIVRNSVKVMRTEGWNQLTKSNRPDLLAVLLDRMTITID